MPDQKTGDVLLACRGLTRRWGGLVAVNQVTLDFGRGAVHAVIGTNGAGKSTLINLLSGEIPPSEGTVQLLGNDVTGWTQPRRARAGLGRSYQRNTIYPTFTVFENCRLAAQARTPAGLGGGGRTREGCDARCRRPRCRRPRRAWRTCSSAPPAC
jgi:branched-chain amino acid transport system ATP-binding protein